MGFSTHEVATVSGPAGAFTTWKSIEVSRMVTQPVSYLKFSGVEPMVNGAIVGPQFMLGNKVSATLGGQQVFSGFITVRQAAYDAKNRGVQFLAASRTQDAVTATVRNTPGQYLNQTMQQMCSAVCGPIGLNVSVLANNVTFPRVSEQPGETIMTFMQRLARHCNVHAWDDANGNLYFGSFSGGSSSGATLTEGGNILSARFNADDQYADAVVNGLGQNVGGSPTNQAGFDVSQIKATVANPGYPSGPVARQGTCIADLPCTPAILNLRAQHEVELMNIDQLEVSVTVQGWFAQDGQCWLNDSKLRSTISLNSPSLYPGTIGLKLKGARCMQNDKEGTTSELILTNERGLQSGPSIGAPAA
jgi:prophage tail gpP-like protein